MKISDENKKPEPPVLHQRKKRMEMFEKEFESFISEKYDSSIIMLQYWKEMRKKFPILSFIAQIYLCPPPGSAASERI
jgi:hypothetical protein